MLTGDWLIQKFIEIDSTQNYAKSLNTDGKQIAIIADVQTAGYGQNTKKWISESGNLHISCVIPIKDTTPQITFVIAIALGDVILELGKHLNLQYKWVNDILIDEKKVAGILVEQLNNNLIIGIGCNLKYSPKIESGLQSTSLAEFGIQISAEEFFTMILNNITKYYNDFINDGFEKFRRIWKSRGYKMNKEVSISVNNNTISGIFCDLDENGAVVLEFNQSIIRLMNGSLT